ncbi:MAG: DUF1570 domain-containing protein [Planctomycetota bacterium]|nr:DUF1570 domain-containing protein [Planctomycetota bacterium]
MGNEHINVSLRGRTIRVAVYATTVATALAGVGVLAANAKDRNAPPDVRRPAAMKDYQTRYYQLHTDLPADTVTEAKRRLTLMAEEYWARTKSFGGVIRDRMDFFIFKNYADYIEAGTPPDSAGVFMHWTSGGKRNGRMMAILSSPEDWHVVQHEGFHQFVHMTMSGDIPIWSNEGLAEYFGEGIWTGDTFVLGVVPERRLRRVVKLIEQDRMMTPLDMMKLTHEDWNFGLSGRNYDQAWSMVHFLAHGDGGKYQNAYAAFLGAVAKGQPWEKAWIDRFGRDTDKFRNVYSAWWKAQGANPPTEPQTRALVHTMTSFLARAAVLKLKFETSAEFFAAAKDGKLKLDPVKQVALWLPEALLSGALAKVPKAGDWSLDTKAAPKLLLTDPQGGKFVGSYILGEGKVTTQVAYTPPPKSATAPAKPVSGSSSSSDPDPLEE